MNPNGYYNCWKFFESIYESFQKEWFGCDVKDMKTLIDEGLA